MKQSTLEIVFDAGILIMFVFGILSIALGFIILDKLFTTRTLDTNGIIENLPTITLPLTIVGFIIAIVAGIYGEYGGKNEKHI